MTTPKTYTLMVADADEVNLLRIVNENAGAKWIVVRDKRTVSDALLLIRKDWLGRFWESDSLLAGGAALCDDWGTGNQFFFRREARRCLPDEWRGCTGEASLPDSWAGRIIPTKDLPAALTALERADHYVRGKMCIEVTAYGDKP